MCFQIPKKIITIKANKAKLEDGSWVDLSLMNEDCAVNDWLFIAEKFAVAKAPNSSNLKNIN